MSKGNLTKLVQTAKSLLVTDPDWYKSFKERPNNLRSISEEVTGNSSPLLNNRDVYEAAGVLARLQLVSRWMGPSKSTTLTVTPEKDTIISNKVFKESTRRALQQFLNETDWIRYGGEDSFLTNVAKDLSRAVISAGGKSRATSGSRKASKVSTTIRRGELANRVTENKDSSEFDISLISLINAKLPPAVRANMGQNGALFNRTGRFSESVRVAGVENTPQGYPRLLYTYQRAPYDVFDPVIGSLPWATPGRDPKKLIDKSIRDIAKDMAIGRFYTRRI
jgi:hypothetical protein